MTNSQLPQDDKNTSKNLYLDSYDRLAEAEIIKKTNQLIERLGWTEDRSRTYLLKTYGKRSRLHLTDWELVEFLRYLEELERSRNPYRVFDASNRSNSSPQPNDLKVPQKPIAELMPPSISVEMIQRSNQLIKQLGWTEDRGRKHLLENYGKRSRLHLTDDELVEFLDYLEELNSESNSNNS
ncbi:hypothetical protein IQ249_20910 [Lusitaniella coriacea LEGE 07157]|uniref:Uncharacterized protein n=1 Tax=Lusitaniella coriacea LEGE 07157 TaxID=945747 RepID=A0A8J7DZB2_9CYAN|nr:hypothetical protein [Lusitaniella coriacea]MBE9118356.1 hypothetical protein [Lusitaniella coriacea LEGE 07157]